MLHVAQTFMMIKKFYCGNTVVIIEYIVLITNNSIVLE